MFYFDLIDTPNGYQATAYSILDDVDGDALIATLDYTENEEGRGYWSIAVRRQGSWGADGELVFRVSDRFDRREEGYDYLPADVDVIDAGDWLHDALIEAKVVLGHLRRWTDAGATMFDGVTFGAWCRMSDLATVRS